MTRRPVPDHGSWAIFDRLLIRVQYPALQGRGPGGIPIRLIQVYRRLCRDW